MLEKIDKRKRAALLRDRLSAAMRLQQLSQAALAERSGIDRSTVSQILKGDGARLPNAHIIGAFGEILGVSTDWLLGLSERPEQAQALLDTAFEMPDAPRALIDDQVFAWHKEAAGYKIRYVPAALPDLLKTPEFLTWEYTPHLGRTADQAIKATTDRLNWMRNSPSDYEIAIPRHELESMARAQGYYSGLSAELRRAQLGNILALQNALYPRLRIYLFDARQVYSSPLSIFGPLLVALYVGTHYVTFRDTNRIRSFTGHFDKLVRQAEVGARECPRVLEALINDIV